MTKALDPKRMEQVVREVRRALAADHPDTRAGRFNPNLGEADASEAPVKRTKRA